MAGYDVEPVGIGGGPAGDGSPVGTVPTGLPTRSCAGPPRKSAYASWPRVAGREPEHLRKAGSGRRSGTVRSDQSGIKLMNAGGTTDFVELSRAFAGYRPSTFHGRCDPMRSATVGSTSMFSALRSSIRPAWCGALMNSGLHTICVRLSGIGARTGVLPENVTP